MDLRIVSIHTMSNNGALRSSSELWNFGGEGAQKLFRIMSVGRVFFHVCARLPHFSMTWNHLHLRTCSDGLPCFARARQKVPLLRARDYISQTP